MSLEVALLLAGWIAAGGAVWYGIRCHRADVARRLEEVERYRREAGLDLPPKPLRVDTGHGFQRSAEDGFR